MENNYRALLYFFLFSMVVGVSFLRKRTRQRLPGFLIFLGIQLRLIQYLANRSLWLDEAMLALNIINRTFAGLLGPLDQCQGGPVGFIMLEKVAVSLFGGSEYALRIVPFLAGVLSIFLFYQVAKRCLAPNAALIALGLFAVSPSLIYFSSEAKQYSMDVAATLALYLVALYIKTRELTPSRILFLGFVGGTLLYLSVPAALVLTGESVVLFLIFSMKKRWRGAFGFLAIIGIWALAGAGCYYLSRGYLDLAKNALKYYWGPRDYMPLSISFSTLKWLATAIGEPIKEIITVSAYGVKELVLIVGSWSLYKKRDNFFILSMPLVCALLASGFHLYPFFGRHLLFLIPFVLLFASEGAEFIRDKTWKKAPVIGVSLIGLLFFYPIFSPEICHQRHMLDLFKRHEIRPVMEYIARNKQNEDTLYVSGCSHAAFRYYSARYGFDKNGWVEGVGALQQEEDIKELSRNPKDNAEAYMNDLRRVMSKPRVWFVFSAPAPVRYMGRTITDESFFLYNLDRLGRKLDYIRKPGASAYLYNVRLSDQ